jgi:hypothetical protein
VPADSPFASPPLIPPCPAPCPARNNLRYRPLVTLTLTILHTAAAFRSELHSCVSLSHISDHKSKLPVDQIKLVPVLAPFSVLLPSRCDCCHGFS